MEIHTSVIILRMEILIPKYSVASAYLDVILSEYKGAAIANTLPTLINSIDIFIIFLRNTR